MKRYILPLLLPSLCVALCAAEPTPPKGFRSLFNGRDLTGWHGLNPHSVAKLTGEKRDAMLAKMHEEFPRHWRVENGELVSDGTGPYATTDEEFGDYELLIEYKIAPNADSGIYLRGHPQVQIWDKNQALDPARPGHRPDLGSGGLFNNTPRTLGRDPFLAADKPVGEWNTLRISQIGARVWVTLNTRLVVDGAPMENYWEKGKPFPARGPLMLQTHGGEIRWRAIYVRDISDASARRVLATPPPPEPTYYDVAYGPHPKHLIHFWKAESSTPTPLVLFIHGGGWSTGGRLSGLSSMIHEMLSRGISVASVGYRFLAEAKADQISPPVKGPLHDAARALQFIRSKAGEWNIDKTRIAGYGGSAGGCTVLWLALHPDMADPASSDPVSRESTRLFCAAVRLPQTTLDPKQMKEWTPNSDYGGAAFGLGTFDNFLAKRDTILEWIAEYSPYALISRDDPPLYLSYRDTPALGVPQKDPTHTANFGVKFQEQCRANGVDCEFVYPGAPGVRHADIKEYLIAMLAASKR